MSLHAELIRSVIEAPAAFADVVTQSPEAAVLFAIGALLVGVSMGALGWLVLGAAVESVTPPPDGRTHRPS